ncbi:ferredoxin [Lichtheimia hyalospora FSU 10163]|uniref:2Fe-2S ferredoxin-type domain-containing protein n=1 Tax=Lichtheimia ornata TaxID=688661 RepID=A0AAD7UTS6_9FUNG|nr:uncharacterized protein O0I10_011374 [Lichtheimia ornata]KAI7878746.1 ferredoxin [Lichtheimia hyalospora FSU 10163]KAJ8652993.1 hypothetical protein O0I10_011374 [Lichtheimia ornata]
MLRLFTSKASTVSASFRKSVAAQHNWKRTIATAPVLLHGKGGISRGEGPYTVHFIMPDGEEISVKAVEGDSMLDLAQRYDIDLECACEGSLACSTCHVICEPDYYDKMEEPSDEENDMLDLAFGLTETSRLGCQIFMNDELDGLTVRLPSATRNLRVDGSKPVHH